MGSPPPPTLDASEVQVGTPNGPGIYLGEVGATPPADTTSDWGSDWNLLGYLSDDGPTVGQNTDHQDITPWQSVAPIRSVITGRQVTLQFIMWQLNATTLGLYFDTDVPTAAADGSLSMDVRTDQAGHQYAVGIDAADGERVLRIVFARANLTDSGDMAIKRGATVPLDVTLSALETNGSLATVLLGPATAGTRMAPSHNGTGARNGNGNGGSDHHGRGSSTQVTNDAAAPVEPPAPAKSKAA